VTPLAGLVKLKELYLHSTPVSDLTPLLGLKDLQELGLTGVPVSEEQVQILQEAIPKCRIIR